MFRIWQWKHRGLSYWRHIAPQCFEVINESLIYSDSRRRRRMDFSYCSANCTKVMRKIGNSL